MTDTLSKTPIPDKLKSQNNTAGIPTVAESSTGTMGRENKWNTKNLGWRLCTDVIAGVSAAAMVAPLIAIIDRGIMENASGKRALRDSITHSLKDLVLKPQAAIFSKPFALICMVYGGTYMTANTLDTVTSTVRNKPATLITSGTLKFALPSASNIGLCLIKDASFAKMFGMSGPPRAIPGPSYALFAIRDCLTIFASFNVPPMLGPLLTSKMSSDLQTRISGQTIAQFAAPAGVQLISTPLHLWGLDLYNRSNATWQERWTLIRKNWGISAAARICRIVPAFGFGGVVNQKIRSSLMAKLA